MAVEKSEQRKSEKPCFLVVDDDHQWVMSLSSMLEFFGSRVGAANCGGAALKCLSETWYDVVITDLGMHDSNGYGLARRIKDIFPKIRIIIMTEQSCSEIEHHIERTAADGCITKPFNANNLKKVLNDIRQTDCTTP